jgi:hypothetical protein
MGVVALGLSGTWNDAAAGAPVVTARAELTPIRGFPGTGNIADAGFSLRFDYTIGGAEYGGYPPPLVGLTVRLPKGTRVHSSGFPTCPPLTILAETATPACPRGAVAGPVGRASAVVPNAGGRSAELLALEPFYAPSASLMVLLHGSAPAAVRGLATGSYTDLGGAGGGPQLNLEVPLLEPPGARADASLQLLELTIGTAIKNARRTVYYLMAPHARMCPAGGLRFTTTLEFAGLADIGTGPVVSPTAAVGAWPERQLVTVQVRAPCPREPARPPAPPPPKPAPTAMHGSHGLITAPPNSECVGEEGLQVHVLGRRRVRWRRIALLLDGDVLQVLRGRRRSATLSLDLPPGGRFTVKVVARTAHGRRITGTRRYEACPG